MLELGWGEYCPQRRDHSNPDNGGRSARAWAEYFANGQVYVVDLTPKNFADRDEWPNVHLYDRTSQADAAALAEMHAVSGDFDIIIDDASHVSSLTIRSFEILWPFVKPGGYYVIEDLHSSYHPWYFGPREANENPSAPVNPRHPTAMQYFKRIADEAFFRGTKRHGPKVNGSKFEWDCYPRKYWLGYEVESVSFCAPQLIVIRKRLAS
ncbi:MAG: hypothetical protein CK431_04390 [Mycobacterium sp.]|nr:MAG: hypothetical protein CK431_04390 [Mycobacterium sp.]